MVAIVASSMNMEINRTNIYNNTAQFGGVISACNSQVTLMGKGLFSTVDPVLSFCTLYEGEVRRYNLTAPQDPEVIMTAAPPTTSPTTVPTEQPTTTETPTTEQPTIMELPTTEQPTTTETPTTEQPTTTRR